MNKYALETTELRKYYRNGEINTQVLKGINISISEGEFCSIMGESGSGKSTLLHIFGTLDSQTSGDLEISGQNVTGLSDKKKTILRRKTIGFIFQSFYLIQGLTVYENVIMPNLLDGRTVNHAYIHSLLETVGLLHRKEHRPMQLSGGEQQRVAIARALANSPPILLADEPTGNLDSKNAIQIIDLLHTINKENNVTIVMVTHSKELSLQCSRTIYMKDGVIV